MTSGERGLHPNARHHWLMSHLNQAAIFHHCSFSQTFIPLCAEDLVIVIRCDGAGIPSHLWLQFNLVSTPPLSLIALVFIVCLSTVVFCWRNKAFMILLKVYLNWMPSMFCDCTHASFVWSDPWTAWKSWLYSCKPSSYVHTDCVYLCLSVCLWQLRLGIA